MISHPLIEAFLPFDLESAFSCAFVLSLMSALPLFSDMEHDSLLATTFQLLDAMVAKGNVVAGKRKGELKMLLETLHLVQLETCPPSTVDDQTQLDSAANIITNLGGHPAPEEPRLDTLGTVNGLSPDHMLSIAGLLDWDPDLPTQYDGHPTAGWLWAESDAAVLGDMNELASPNFNPSRNWAP